MRALTGFLLLTVATASSAAELRDLRLLDGPDATRVVFDLDQESQPKVFTLANPDRVVIDFSDARRAPTVAVTQTGKGLIKAVRTGPRDKGLRVVLDTGAKVSPQSFGLQPTSGYGYRLILDLYPEHPGKGAKPSAPTPAPAEIVASVDAPAPGAQPSVAAQSPVPAAPAVVSAAEPAAAAHPNPTPAAAAPAPAPAPAPAQIAAAAANATPASPAIAQSAASSRVRVSEKEIVIAVDAGHGGNDPGAIGPTGLQEKAVTLAIAKRLAAKINGEPGMRAVLTRGDDTFVELRTRTVRARQAEADLFVSVHANSINNREMSGTAVYVLSNRGASSEHARWLANHENAADLVGGVELQNKDDDLAAVLIDISQSATMEASFDLGSRLLNSLGRVNRLQKAEVQQAGFMVLKSPDIPSVLVETAFISNPREEKLLGDPEYQDKMAHSIFEGVRGYFARYRPQQIAVAGPTRSGAGDKPRSVPVRLKR